MKYPKQQFEILVKALKVLKNNLDISNIHPSSLHFLVYQQFAEGQEHNKLYLHNDKVIKNWSLSKTDLLTAKEIIDFKADFELYPNDCNDTNIETAVKKALITIK